MGNVDIEALHALYDDLAVDGAVPQSPISTLAIRTFPILHALLRDLD